MADLSLKEHEQLTELLSQIPHKVQRGIKREPEILELTSIDANKQYIALGSNIGTVFLYDREKHTIERLRSDNTYDCVISVCLHHGLDDMVAVGFTSGAIHIFQLPSMKLGHSKKLEKIIVPDLHDNPIQCLTWTTNGMKLYSGDRKGSVGCTEVDFYEGKCTSTVLLIESKTEIVQLSSGHRSLLVSTKHRCLVCRIDEQNRIVQVGSKDRKIIGDFGACFIPAMCKPDDAQLFASRPGYRIWKASIQGTVSNTFIFKDILMVPHTEIQLLPFEITDIIKSEGLNQFGPIHLLNDRYLVTWNASCLYVVDPDKTALVGSQKYMGCIKSVVVTEDEIFVLRMGTDRHVIRIAFKPLPSSSSQILRHLQEQRKEREKEEEEEDKEGVANEKSSFKLLQGNILDKVKKLSNPLVLKEKLQNKLKNEHKSDTSPSKYESQAYVFDQDEDHTTKEESPVPSGILPPVIELDSPELMKLKIDDLNIIEDRTKDKSLEIESIPFIEGFSYLSSDRSLETEITQDQSVNITRTGTGAISALAKLQEEHEQDEIADPVYKMNTVQLDKNVRDPFSFVVPETEDDSIVFNKKSKGKTKKKKKGIKEQKPKSHQLSVEKDDQDSISVHSVTSVHSDLSETLCNSGNQDNQAIATRSSSLNTEIYGQTLITESETRPSDGTRTICKGSEEAGSSAVSNGSEEAGNTAVSNGSEEAGSTTISYQSEKGNCLMHGVMNSLKKEGDLKLIEDCEPVQIPFPETCVEQSITSDTNSEMHSSLIVKEHNISNLDREISRLNSFLSGTSEVEQAYPSIDSNTQSLDSSQAKFHDILLKDTRNDQQDTPSTTDGLMMDSDKEYIPSSLEQQLNEFEHSTLTAVDDDNQTFTENGVPVGLPSLTSLDLQPTSIYSMYKTPSTSGEDFYSKYGLTSPDISLNTPDPYSDPADHILTVDHGDDNTDKEDSEEIEDKLEDNVMESSVKVSEIPSTLKSVNNWTEVNAPGNINSLSVSHTHVWITDRSCNIYHSSVKDTGISWKKASGYANQISVSKNGNIVWRLYKGVVYAGTKITPKHPEGMKWVEAVKDVMYICVAETCAWYIKTTYEVMIQKSLSKERPCYTAQSVDCSYRLKQIVCQSGVVWALTESCQWLYRDGVTAHCPEGTLWKSGDSDSEKKLFSYISLGDGNLGWAVDVVGQVWFCCDVTIGTPRGDGKWWQVPLSGEYIMKDLSAYDLLKSVSKKFDPIKLTQLLSTQSGGLVGGRDGVWVCPEFKHTLHVCYGSIQGHLWNEAHPDSMVSSSVWKTVLARNASPANGVLWGQQPNGDLFCFTPNRQTCNSVEVPKSSVFVCMSLCADALWGLTADGTIYIRTGMSPSSLQGVSWCQLDLSQLDGSHLVSVSCGKMNVWAVDSDGNVFHRIGARAPSDHNLNAAWLPVDNRGTQFTKVIAGCQDWMVWAIDNKRQVYVRKGITLEMPIGREWVHVSGSPAMCIALSDNFVWAINHSGELLCRHGVNMDNVTGDYWKIVPGNFMYITVSPDDALWGVSKEGQLLRRYTKYVINNAQEWGTGSRKTTREPSGGSEDGDWEFV